MTTSVWRRIHDDIREKIESGELRSGTKLPSTRQLVQQYGHMSLSGSIAAGTVRQAITVLTAAGYLVGQQGLGVYVADRSAIK